MQAFLDEFCALPKTSSVQLNIFTKFIKTVKMNEWKDLSLSSFHGIAVLSSDLWSVLFKALSKLVIRVLILKERTVLRHGFEQCWINRNCPSNQS